MFDVTKQLRLLSYRGWLDVLSELPGTIHGMYDTGAHDVILLMVLRARF